MSLATKSNVALNQKYTTVRERTNCYQLLFIPVKRLTLTALLWRYWVDKKLAIKAIIRKNFPAPFSPLFVSQTKSQSWNILLMIYYCFLLKAFENQMDIFCVKADKKRRRKISAFNLWRNEGTLFFSDDLSAKSERKKTFCVSVDSLLFGFYFQREKKAFCL